MPAVVVSGDVDVVVPDQDVRRTSEHVTLVTSQLVHET
jgi:hypothetical protein